MGRDFSFFKMDGLRKFLGGRPRKDEWPAMMAGFGGFGLFGVLVIIISGGFLTNPKMPVVTEVTDLMAVGDMCNYKLNVLWGGKCWLPLYNDPNCTQLYPNALLQVFKVDDVCSLTSEYNGMATSMYFIGIILVASSVFVLAIAGIIDIIRMHNPPDEDPPVYEKVPLIDKEPKPMDIV